MRLSWTGIKETHHVGRVSCHSLSPAAQGSAGDLQVLLHSGVRLDACSGQSQTSRVATAPLTPGAKVGPCTCVGGRSRFSPPLCRDVNGNDPRFMNAGKSWGWKAELAQKSETRQASRIFCRKIHFGHGTCGVSVLQRKVGCPVCNMAPTHAVQTRNQGGHGPPSASDLIFLVRCWKKRIFPCLPEHAGGVWRVCLYAVGQGEVCVGCKYARARNTALIAQLCRRQR